MGARWDYFFKPFKKGEYLNPFSVESLKNMKPDPDCGFGSSCDLKFIADERTNPTIKANPDQGFGPHDCDIRILTAEEMENMPERFRVKQPTMVIGKKKAKPKPTSPTEHTEQCIVVDWLRIRGVSFFSVPNGSVIGGRDKWGLIKKLQKEGMTNGAPDLVIIQKAPARPGKFVAVEMKRRSGSKVSDEQRVFLNTMQDAGWIVIIANGARDAILKLQKLGY